MSPRQQAKHGIIVEDGSYRAMFDNMLNAMAYCRLVYEGDNPVDYIYLSVNKAFANQTGLTDVVGKRASEVIPGVRESDAGLFQAYGRVVKTGTPERFEYFVNALQMWVSLSVYTPAKDHFVAIFDVITERKKAEAALKNSEAALQHAQRQAKLGNWEWKRSTNVPTWSTEMFRIFGRDPASPPAGFREIQQYFTSESWARVAVALKKCMAEGVSFACDAEVMHPDGSHCFIVSRGEAKRDSNGDIVGIFGTVQDITERKRTENHIQRLNQFYTGLSRCNEAMLRCTSEKELFQRMCQLIVEIGGIKMAWIGLVDAARQQVKPVASHGEGMEYLEGIQVSVDPDDPHSGGPTGLAIRENRPQWFKDFSRDPRTAPWHERSARFGWHASAALPICRGGKPVGAMTMYSTGHGWSDEEVRKLLGNMAADISFALDRLAADTETRTYQAILADSEQRFSCLVEQSIAGAFIIQDGNFVYVNPRLAQILGYSDTSALFGRTPLEIVTAKDRDIAERLMNNLLDGEKASVSHVFTALRKDGTPVEVGINGSLATYRQRPAIIGLMQDISDKQVAEEQIKRYTTQLQHSFMQTVALATTLSEMRDPYTAGHERRVADIAVAIGTEMGLDENRLEGLKVGGYLHDVGKTAVPLEILAKPGKITPLEYQMIKAHPQAGYEVLKDVDFPWPVAQIALQHHERMDGSGYPRGLKGEQIMLEARIMAVADVIEAMASHRPFRPGLGIEKALAEIERGRGTAYDPAVVDVCLRLFREKGYVLPS